MFDSQKYLTTTKKYADFKYWFRREKGHTDAFEVVDKTTNQIIGIYNWFLGTFRNVVTGEDMPEMVAQVNESFTAYRERPEYQVGRAIDMTKMNPELAISVYETLLVGIQFIRAEANHLDPDESYSGISSTLDWLRQTDFYTAPASTRYHESYDGGLVLHHLNVYNGILQLMKLDKFYNHIELHSACLLALTHDWCKIGFYESYMRNVKDEETGQWDKKKEWKYREIPLMPPLGHGVTSMYLVGRCFRLSQEEAAALRWHMGWCRVADSEMNELQAANIKYPSVHLLQFADQLSIVEY